MQDSVKEPSLDVSTRKKNLTLDLHQVQNYNTRRSKVEAHKNASSLLSSPDLHKLNLKTPELESLIIQQNNMEVATPTPNTTQILFPKAVTEEQERYARGFEDALNELHCSDSSQGANQAFDVSNSNSSNSITTYTDLDPRQVGGYPSISSTYNTLSPLGIVIKDEPQTVPNEPQTVAIVPDSPINMADQEVIKLERKRYRNRVAASKCRKRKLERIAKLEQKVKDLKDENNGLSVFLVKLKDQVCTLKRQVLEHVNHGCQIMNYT